MGLSAVQRPLLHPYGWPTACTRRIIDNGIDVGYVALYRYVPKF